MKPFTVFEKVDIGKEGMRFGNSGESTPFEKRIFSVHAFYKDNNRIMNLVIKSDDKEFFDKIMPSDILEVTLKRKQKTLLDATGNEAEKEM